MFPQTQKQCKMALMQPYLSSTTISKPIIEQDSIVEVEESAELLWKIIAHDDDYTTMDFVIRIMLEVFRKPLIFAEAIMWQVHNEGQSIVDAQPKAEAESRVRRAMLAARLEGFPFKLTIEPA